jgi:hypothetical protein
MTKRLTAFVLCALALYVSSPVFGKIQYQFPANGATAISRTTSIIIRPGDYINSKTVSASLITVKGAFSGNHSGAFVLSDDKKTLVFTPTFAFTYSERVTVTLKSGIKTTSGQLVGALSFYFTIQSKPATGKNSIKSMPDAASDDPSMSYPNPPFLPVSSALGGIVNFTPKVIDNPAPGNIFVASFMPNDNPQMDYAAIVNDSGRVLWSHQGDSKLMDFKRQDDGRFSYYNSSAGKFYVMDTTLTIRDSFATQGYWTDVHDIELLPHNHALLLAYDTESKVDLSQYVAGGNTNAMVVGVVIQEIDSLKNAIFTWRSFDSGRFQLEDMTLYPNALTRDYVDEVHANSVTLDHDGNILLSSRHLDEITKIDRDSIPGRIIWRWGGKKNQFTFVNDSVIFSYQHHVRRLPNGNITVFDNGNFHKHSGSYSRACEYALDEQTKTATLVWSFDHAKQDTSGFMGDVERLSNGNTFIGWGGNNRLSGDSLMVTEVRPDGSIAFEMDMTPAYCTYRAFRFDWTPSAALAGVGPHYSSDISSGLTLNAVYPNPARVQANISLNLPHSSETKLIVLNSIGEHVASIESGVLQAGPHDFTFDVSNWPNGVYRALLVAGNESRSASFVVVW